MLISAGIAKTKGFNASFTALFGLWTTRPRIAFATLIWHFGIFAWPRPSKRRSSSGPDEERTVRQRVKKLWRKLSRRKTLYYKRTYRDVLLAENLLNILSFPFALHFLQDERPGGPICTNPNVVNPSVPVFFDSMRWCLIAGGVSVLLLCAQIIHYVQYGGEIRRDGGRFVFIVGPIIMFGTLISNWVLWACELANSKDSAYVEC